ncbi:MAG: ATP-binding protein [Chloroflexi bacterium]|nr:ATP-binding protein [Chloroflexota bacterium]
MNNSYSPPEYYYQRWLTPTLRAASEDHPVVVLTGARQVGKSSLLLNADPFRQWRYLTMDDFDVLQQAREYPDALWAGTEQIVIDEVQKAPEVLLAVKRAVDNHPGKFRFILSGSANLLLMRQVGESLAGRAVYFVLSPLALGERNQVSPPDILSHALRGDWLVETSLAHTPPDPVPILLQGSMPALLRLDKPSAWVRWWDGYVSTYLERDLRQISQISALLDFRRVMEFLALRTGQLLNRSEIARDAQLSQPTVHRYVNLLETTHLFERLPAYTPSRTTRLLKSPKAFWTDPGLAVFLSGYFDDDDLRGARELGSYFETLIFQHLRVLVGLMTPPARLYYWRMRKGPEVDFIVEHGRRLLGIEVKLTSQPRYGDTTGLQSFLCDYPQATGGLLLHSGKTIRRLGENILAVPWTTITG